mmetsp:Transcript_10272/g.15834  ORF Transcript_10272/g.15834 Transcript_10272/m.15834 type:complete len:276 (+) Transcript_10272:52-879(+)
MKFCHISLLVTFISLFKLYYGFQHGPSFCAHVCKKTTNRWGSATTKSTGLHTQINLFGIGGDDKTISPDAPKLSSDFVWRLALVMQKPTVPDVERNIQVWVRFVETPGYEPPQGKVFIERDPFELVAKDEKGFGGFWQLSEDKDDVKDGLWVWGLFEEPLYPFLYFSLNTNKKLTEKITMKKTEGEEEPETETRTITIFGDDEKDFEGIPNDKLLIRFDHRRYPKDVGTKLTEGVLTFKPTEIVKADLLGISSADIGTNVECGKISALVALNKES